MELRESEQLNNSSLRISSNIIIWFPLNLATKPNFAETIFQMQKKKIEEILSEKRIREIEENTKKQYDSYELR